MRQVYSASTPTEAHMIQGFLETAGITAFVQGDALFGVRGGVPMNSETAPSVWVADADFEQASTLVADFFREQAASAADDWTCPSCGEVLEGQFTECWNCGTSRPEAASDAE